ncbi:MAG: cupin domain-containing protein [Candidatus Dormibacteraceae bacterium]
MEHAHAAAYVVGPDDGERIQGPAGGPLTFKARGAQTKGQLTIFENFIAPGDGPPLHSHAAEDEYWYVLQGDLRFRLADDLSNAPKGSFVLVPRGTPHCFHNTGDIPAKILVLFTPSGMERFFELFAALPRGADRKSAFASIGKEVGMDVLGPPLSISHPL